MEQKIFCLVGLGNPGREFENTRHNIGYMVADCIADKYGLLFSTYKNIVSLAVYEYGADRVVIAKPLTFMNNSGNALPYLSSRFGLIPDSYLAVYDDFSIPFGKIRIRPSGTSGGHNGLKSLCAALGTENIKRVRVGIGYPESAPAPVDYVLSRFSKTELGIIKKILPAVSDSVMAIFSEGIESCMNKYNSMDFSNDGD